MRSKPSVMKYLELGRGDGAESGDELAGVGVGLVGNVKGGLGGAGGVGRIHLVVGVGVAVLAEEGAKGVVEAVFADVVGEGIEDDGALLVPDVGLVLDQGKGRLVTDLAGAAAEIAVELGFEEEAHVFVAVSVVHDAKGGVLGERLGHHVRALDLAADELVTPPLMTELVGGDEVGVVDVLLGILDAADEAEGLGEGDGVGKGLSELAVTGVLDDAVLRELEGAVVCLVVVQAFLGGVDHLVDIVGVLRVVVDLDVDALVENGLDGVAAGDPRHEVEDVGGAHGVLEEVPAVCGPAALEVAGGEGDLVAGGADDGVVGDPVGLLAGEEVAAGVLGVAARGQLCVGGQVFFAAAARVVKLEIAAVADFRKVRLVEEGAIVGKLRELVAVAEAAALVADPGGERNGFAGRERLVEGVDGIKIAGARLMRWTGREKRRSESDCLESVMWICGMGAAFCSGGCR